MEDKMEDKNETKFAVMIQAVDANEQLESMSTNMEMGMSDSCLGHVYGQSWASPGVGVNPGGQKSGVRGRPTLVYGSL